jgi:hypothetical protein
MNRREFLRKTGLTVGGVALAGGSRPAQGASTAAGVPAEVAIVVDPADSVASAAPAQWALGKLRGAMAGRKMAVGEAKRVEDAPAGAICVVAAGKANAVAARIAVDRGVALPASAQSLALLSGGHGGRRTVLAFGADPTGLGYALTELAEAISLGDEPSAVLGEDRSTVETPANLVRGIGRLFCSDIEDKPWYNDRGFWPRYLDMLATNRFNRFHLALGLGYDTSNRIRDSYFYFPYPFLLKAAGYDVRAKGLPDSERDNNLVMLRHIGDECARRGIMFQLGLWGHQYQFDDSPNVNYPIEGLKKETHAVYCRDALTALLKACPNVGGVTFRIHGESGIAEGNYDFWKTVFDGIVRSGRRVPIEMHAKGSDQKIIEIALATGMPVTLAPKYWAEHMGLPYAQTAIRPLELPKPDRADQGFFAQSSGSRSFLRYGYGDLLAEDRKHHVVHRMWPGTQRMLMWGDPVFASAYGRTSSFCGSDGAEIFEPMSFKGRMGSGLPGGRQGYADDSFKTADDWEKYRYGYVLWGRMLYNPETKPDVWRRVLRDDYGRVAPRVESALGTASRILPLLTTAHAQSASYTAWWAELSWNMPIVDAGRRHPFADTPTPKRFGYVSPLDPQMFARIEDFAAKLVKGESEAKYTPADVAAWLERLGTDALARLGTATGSAEAGRSDGIRPQQHRRMMIDVFIQSKMGIFFAQKLRAGLLWSLYEKTGERSVAEEALKRYEAARKAWAELAERATGVYRDDITYGPGYFQHGHWKDRLEAIDQDVADMEAHAKAPRAATIDAAKAALLVAAVLEPTRGTTNTDHRPPASFVRGRAVTISLHSPYGHVKVPPPIIHYRRVNQAETFRSAEMRVEKEFVYRMTIPADYTDSPFPLQYYFELRNGEGKTCLHPGFNSEWSNQPYHVIRQSRPATSRV